MRRFGQIKIWDRVKIEKSRRKGLSLSEIADITGFDRSTISRELRRNHVSKRAYHSRSAQRQRDERNDIAMGKRSGSIGAETRKWIIEVTGLIDHRMAYAEAIKYYTDHTPPEEIIRKQKSSFVEYTGKRQSRQGRPTKRNRREIDKWME